MIRRTATRLVAAPAEITVTNRVMVNDDWNVFQKYMIRREQERLYPNRNRMLKGSWPLG
ncbi:MAG: hypothetical protein H8E44_35300 [Planctomycetes bacterium]|nr:hypothetical protein [Planctomycetota bacterium]MBL7040064.1 hypothetical protein [Pirellulaceae bacterium]